MDTKITKLCAYLGGGDWTDASVEFLRVPTDCDLNASKAEWRHWYKTVYIPDLKSGAKTVPYLSFMAWLLANRGAEWADEGDIEIIDDD